MRGSSLVRMVKRVDSRPVQASTCLRSMVSASSPEIDSSRSVMAAWSLRPPRRASVMKASDLPISGARPNVVCRLASVGLATLSRPTNAVSVRAMVPLPERRGPTTNRDLLLRGVRRQRVAEPVLQGDDRADIVVEQVGEERQPVLRVGRVRVEDDIGRGEAEVARRRRVKLAAWQVQQAVADREHLGRVGQLVGAVQPRRRVDSVVEAADRGQGVEHVGHARAVGLERHEPAVFCPRGAARLREIATPRRAPISWPASA